MESKQKRTSNLKFNDEQTNIVNRIMNTSSTNLQVDDLEQQMIEIEKSFNCINLKNSYIKAELNVEEKQNVIKETVKDDITTPNSIYKHSAHFKNKENSCWINEMKKSNIKPLPRIINKIILDQVNTKSNDTIEKIPRKSYNRFKWIRGEPQQILTATKTYNLSSYNQNFNQNKHQNEKYSKTGVNKYRMENKNPIRKAKNVTIQYNRKFKDPNHFNKNERNRNEIIENNSVEKNGVKKNYAIADQYRQDYNNTKSYLKKYNWNRKYIEQSSKILKHRNTKNTPKHINNNTHISTRYDSGNGSVKRLQRTGDSSVNTRKKIKVIQTKLFKEAFKIIKGDA